MPTVFGRDITRSATACTTLVRFVAARRATLTVFAGVRRADFVTGSAAELARFAEARDGIVYASLPGFMSFI